MDSELIKLLDNYADKDFATTPVYNADGDFLTIYTMDTDCYSSRVDDALTLFYDDETDEIVGVKIKGVRSLLKGLGPRGLFVKSEGFMLGVLFMSWAFEQDELATKEFEILKYLHNKFGQVTATIATVSENDCLNHHDHEPAC
tara:strand:- start:1772 stop:2200 length:429 start_codon:yes stop_codon:yes gene_type:complete